MMTRPPADHGLMLYMRVGDGPEVLVGTARAMSDVPLLLRAMAEQWERGYVEAEDEYGEWGDVPRWGY